MTSRGISPEARRRYMTKHKYNVTPERIDEMLAEQGGVCAVCKEPPVEGGRPFNVDHDHACCPGLRSCGKCLRGVLCNGCNVGLGMLGDNVDTLLNAIQYLRSPR